MAKKKRKLPSNYWEGWEDEIEFVDKLSPLKKGERPLTSKELEAKGFKGETEEEYKERKRKEERRKATEARKESEKGASPFREIEQPEPERDFSRRAGRPNFLQKAGRKVKGAVVGAVKGVAEMFEGEEADSTPPAWLDDPNVGVSDPNLPSTRAMAQSRGRAKEVGAGKGKGQFWTDPADGATYYKPREDEVLPPTEPVSSDLARTKPVSSRKARTDPVSSDLART